MEATPGQLRRAVLDVGAYRMSLADFETWFVSVSWDVLPSDPAASLVGSIELALAEAARGHRSECDLRRELARLVPRCDAMLSMWDGEYEGDCELLAGHEMPHWDGMTSWREDEHGWSDQIDLDEDRALFDEAARDV